MTPKEKAEEMYFKFYDYANSNYGASKFEKNWHGNVLAGERKVRKESAKQCALIAVDEMIMSNPHSNPFNTNVYSTMGYWQEVKQEIEKL
jgi:hypothetical protein